MAERLKRFNRTGSPSALTIKGYLEFLHDAARSDIWSILSDESLAIGDFGLGSFKGIGFNLYSRLTPFQVLRFHFSRPCDSIYVMENRVSKNPFVNTERLVCEHGDFFVRVTGELKPSFE